MKSSELRIGFSGLDITPSLGIPLSGASTRRAALTLHDRLEARAIVLEQGGCRTAIVGLDLIGIDAPHARKLQAWARAKLGITGLLINGSHTHSGPPWRIPGIDPWIKGDLPKVRAYLRRLDLQIKKMLTSASRTLKPVTVDYGQGTCDFSINRRKKIDGVFHMRPNPQGYRDPRVTVIRFRAKGGRSDGKLLGMLFSYACHPTTFYKDFISGDYPGVARRILESRFDVPALFLQGASADIRPGAPLGPNRGKIFAKGTHAEVARGGRGVAQGVLQGLRGKMRPLTPSLATAEVSAALSMPPGQTPAQLRKTLQNLTPSEEWRRHSLKLLLAKKPAGSLEMRTIAIRLADNFIILGAQHELCSGYVPLIESLVGKSKRLLVLGYSNGFSGYIPTLAVRREGGYEGTDSIPNFALRAPFHLSVEKRILDSWKKVLKRLSR